MESINAFCLNNAVKCKKSKNIDVKLFKEGNYVIAYCSALDLSSYGSNYVDAENSFKEALKILIDELTEKNTLNKELLRLGWTIDDNNIELPKNTKNTKNNYNNKRKTKEKFSISI